MIIDFILNPTTLRVICIVLGLMIVFGCSSNLLRKRSSAMVSAGIMANIFGIGLVCEGIFPGVIGFIIPDAPLARIRFVVAVLSIYMVLLTFESIRLTQLKEKYALLWLVPCGILIGLTCWPDLMIEVRTRFGMEFSSQMVGVMFIAMIFAVYVISMTISTNEKKLAATAQHCALLEQRVEQLEKKLEEVEKEKVS